MRLLAYVDEHERGEMNSLNGRLVADIACMRLRGNLACVGQHVNFQFVFVLE